MDEKQYYRVLGVPRDASVRDIKKAFQALSKKYSPGKNPGNEEWAEKRKLEIVEAYDILSNAETRAQYDQLSPKPVIANTPLITTVHGTTPVRPARIRTPPQNKKPRNAEQEITAKYQRILEAKRAKRSTIFTISGIVAIVIIVVLVFYMITYVLPFEKVIARVDGEAVKIGYFIRRVMMNGQGSTGDTLQDVIDEIIITQEAPKYVGEVTESEIDEFMRKAAQGEAESLTDLEYSNWLRQQLNQSQLTEQQFRELARASLLQSRMYDYLAERTSNVVPQVRLNLIFVATYDEALAAKERIDGGEDFTAIAKEVSLDSSNTNGGDIGWTPVTLLNTQIQDYISDLRIGECSLPIPMNSSNDTTSNEPSSYALAQISEKSDVMEVTAEQLQGLQQVAFESWHNETQASKQITFHGIHNQYLDSETFAWIDYQVSRLLKGIKTTYATTDVEGGQ